MKHTRQHLIALRVRMRFVAALIGFIIGLTAFAAYNLLPHLPARKIERRENVALSSSCEGTDFFRAPEEILAGLTNADPGVRRRMHRRALLQPAKGATFYDYERDAAYPSRIEQATVKYVNLDDDRAPEAVLNLVRYEHPVAIILKQEACGWRIVALLGAWLRFEDYPYKSWLEFPETVQPGVHEILIRESGGDAIHYSRRVRLLKMDGDALAPIADFDEERIASLEGYAGKDWQQVKSRAMSRITFSPATADSTARIEVTTTNEVVKYTGQPAMNEHTDANGARHSSNRHWHTAARVRLGTPQTRTTRYEWSAQARRFVAKGE